MLIIAQAINQFFYVLTMLIFIRAILSFFIRNPYNNKLYSILVQITEPMLAPFRRLTYRFGANYGIDFSPLLAIFALQFLNKACLIILSMFM